eukprot:c19143_g1_i5.p1 GENE.c19143_g1_i5~~c19143_g1_i5.p1  ORF type:complete len:244 (+),score=29.93 c19143_g1_i5:294-1025(+)
MAQTVSSEFFDWPALTNRQSLVEVLTDLPSLATNATISPEYRATLSTQQHIGDESHEANSDDEGPVTDANIRVGLWDGLLVKGPHIHGQILAPVSPIPRGSFPAHPIPIAKSGFLRSFLTRVPPFLRRPDTYPAPALRPSDTYKNPPIEGATHNFSAKSTEWIFDCPSEWMPKYECINMIQRSILHWSVPAPHLCPSSFRARLAVTEFNLTQVNHSTRTAMSYPPTACSLLRERISDHQRQAL